MYDYKFFTVETTTLNGATVFYKSYLNEKTARKRFEEEKQRENVACVTLNKNYELAEEWLSEEAERFNAAPAGYVSRVNQLESEGLTTSDAQAAADVEILKAEAPKSEEVTALLEALDLIEGQVEAIYTASTTNAMSRDQNRRHKQTALKLIRDALAKHGRS